MKNKEKNKSRTHREQVENTPRTHREQVENTPRTSREHTENKSRTTQHVGNTQQTENRLGTNIPRGTKRCQESLPVKNKLF